MKKIILLIGIIMIVFISGCNEVTERVHHKGEPCDFNYSEHMGCNITYEEPNPECAKIWDEEMEIVKIKGYCEDGKRIGGVW